MRCVQGQLGAGAHVGHPAPPAPGQLCSLRTRQPTTSTTPPQLATTTTTPELPTHSHPRLPSRTSAVAHGQRVVAIAQNKGQVGLHSHAGQDDAAGGGVAVGQALGHQHRPAPGHRLGASVRCCHCCPCGRRLLLLLLLRGSRGLLLRFAEGLLGCGRELSGGLQAGRDSVCSAHAQHAPRSSRPLSLRPAQPHAAHTAALPGSAQAAARAADCKRPLARRTLTPGFTASAVGNPLCCASAGLPAGCGASGTRRSPNAPLGEPGSLLAPMPRWTTGRSDTTDSSSSSSEEPYRACSTASSSSGDSRRAS